MFHVYLHIIVNSPGAKPANVFEANAELLRIGILKSILAWNQLCYISQELHLSTYTVVIKQEKLQHAASYDME